MVSGSNPAGEGASNLSIRTTAMADDRRKKMKKSNPERDDISNSDRCRTRSPADLRSERLRSNPAEINPVANNTLYKISPPGSGSSSSGREQDCRPRLPINNNSDNNGRKPLNWRLACFLANEYLSRAGGRDPPGDRRSEDERLYRALAEILRSDDVHLPGIVNPAQLGDWLGFGFGFT